MLEEVDLFAGDLIARQREGGLPRLRVWRFSGEGPEAARAGEIAFPEPAYSAQPQINRIFDHTHLPLRLPIAGDSGLGLRIRRSQRRIHAA